MRRIFDAHLHCSEDPNDPLIHFARMNGLSYTLEELLRLMAENGVYSGLLLSAPLKDWSPISSKKILELCNRSRGTLKPTFTVEPSKEKVAQEIELAKKHRDELKGFKIRLGYNQVYAYDKIYDPLYDYAESIELPVLFHTGDTASTSGSLMHSHPLTIDRLANERPALKIVICHFGNPWFDDVGELIYKHPNVHADISGLAAGSGGTRFSEGYLDFLGRRLSEAASFAGGVDKFIFGTDYPIETYATAMKLVGKLKLEGIDEEKLLHLNAEKLFKI